MKPSIGRIVHYLPPGADADTECMAAIVTFVGHDGNPALKVFWPPLVSHVPSGELAAVPFAPALPCGGTWHWPERVEHEAGDRPAGY